MATLRQIQANRRNALKSTGPTSVTGKAVSSMNALKTGLHAKTLVLSSEKLSDLEALIDDHYRQHNPTTPEARFFVDDLIHSEWLLRRLRAAETQIWRDAASDMFASAEFPLGYAAKQYPSVFAKLQHRLDSTRRACLRALQALKQLRSETPPVEPTVSPSPQTASPEIGFVPPPTLPDTFPLPHFFPGAPENQPQRGIDTVATTPE